MSPSGADKRKDKRLQLTLPVKFFLGSDKNLAPCDGVTHNVSSGGVYFEAPASMASLDGHLFVRIGVPATQDEDKPNLTLVGTGTVCRVEKLEPERVMGAWPETQRNHGIYGVALQFRQRPTVELKSLEGLLWEDRDR
jgi:hypothetical protein